MNMKKQVFSLLVLILVLMPLGSTFAEEIDLDISIEEDVLDIDTGEVTEIEDIMAPMSRPVTKN